MSTVIIPANVTGSVGSTPKSSEPRTRVPRSDTPVPIVTPSVARGPSGPPHLFRRLTECHPDADLGNTLGHEVGQHGVDAHSGEKQCTHGACDQELERESARRNGALDHRIERAVVLGRHLRIDLPNCRPDRPGDVRGGQRRALYPADPDRPQNPSRFYGPLKADCERIVRGIYPSNSTQVRPGWIAGPGDNNHLLTYWVVRIDRGNEVLAPGVPDDYMQLTDVRDLAEWYIHIAETRLTGAYSAVGQVMSWAEWLYGIRAVTSSEVSFTWVNADFLLNRGAAPWMNIPLWWPARNDWGPRAQGGNVGGEGAFAIDPSLAWANGLGHRTVADTAKSTLDWYRESFDDWPEDRRPGFSAARERELLDAWRRENG